MPAEQIEIAWSDLYSGQRTFPRAGCEDATSADDEANLVLFVPVFAIKLLEHRLKTGSLQLTSITSAVT